MYKDKCFVGSPQFGEPDPEDVNFMTWTQTGLWKCWGGGGQFAVFSFFMWILAPNKSLISKNNMPICQSMYKEKVLCSVPR